jgi:integrase
VRSATPPSTAIGHSAYKEGIRLGKVKENVARLIRQRKEPKGRKRFLSRSEYADLYAASKDPGHKEEFAVSVLAGMRLTEQYTAEWGQVDFERDEINLTATKNGEDRTVSMNSKVREILLARKERTKESGASACSRVREKPSIRAQGSIRR